MFRDALDIYSEESTYREHFLIADIRWDSERRAVVIEADEWGLTPRHAADGIAEEIFEITVAVVVGNWEGFLVDILYPASAAKGCEQEPCIFTTPTSDQRDCRRRREAISPIRW
jgi:hypothetical protein